MSEIVIKAENISKLYQLGEISTGTLARDLHRWWYKIRGKEDPFKKVGETNDRTTKSESNLVWALKDVNFEVKRGEVLGVIGKNGAGKSTLLKILSRVTKPTEGSIKIKGRIASLLEVGTGFHPELTGRENIFLNGAILGMTKAEIYRKLDEIIAFSGVERYIDTPVKRYSSGMYVRLAFAVAAHLEPEILVIDEVLAVGDAEFQKKCLGKMKDVSEKEGRTVLFVSHNMGAIAQLCTSCLFMKHGTVMAAGNPDAIVQRYMNENAAAAAQKFVQANGQKRDLCFTEAYTLNQNHEPTSEFLFTDSIELVLGVQINQYVPGILLSAALLDKFGNRVFTEFVELEKFYTQQSFIRVKLTIPDSIIAPNTYSFHFALFVQSGKVYDIHEEKCQIKIIDSGTKFFAYEGYNFGDVVLACEWEQV